MEVWHIITCFNERCHLCIMIITCEWYAIVRVSLIPKFLGNSLNNFPGNWVSLSVVIHSRIPNIVNHPPPPTVLWKHLATIHSAVKLYIYIISIDCTTVSAFKTIIFCYQRNSRLHTKIYCRLFVEVSQ